MAELDLSPADEKEIRDILTTWRDSGVENPLLPALTDMDGDGIIDSYGLDSFGNVVVVSGTRLSETVYVSDERGAGTVDLSRYEVKPWAG